MGHAQGLRQGRHFVVHYFVFQKSLACGGAGFAFFAHIEPVKDYASFSNKLKTGALRAADSFKNISQRIKAANG
jgi:hypothetical protein